MTRDEQYISRCLQLAELGAGYVAPNPMVGAVLVYEDKIIGEGYHQKYGEAHAEVNCINNVSDQNKGLVEKSTLYVSLEPCSHYGKTPPCADLIIKSKIKKVVIGCKDIYKEVAGTGISKLKNAGVEVIVGALEKECIELNKRFFTFHQQFRPYIILKWAESVNGKIGSVEKRILISNEYSNRLVHKWRSEEAAILVGTKTALQDDPLLTTRLWNGKNAVRIVIDKDLILPPTLKLFNADSKTLIYNLKKTSSLENLVYIKLAHGAPSGEKENLIDQILQSLFEMNIQSIMVEGGATTLQSLINAGLWDEARVITNKELIIENGISAPGIKDFHLENQELYSNDIISFYSRKS